MTEEKTDVPENQPDQTAAAAGDINVKKTRKTSVKPAPAGTSPAVEKSGAPEKPPVSEKPAAPKRSAPNRKPPAGKKPRPPVDAGSHAAPAKANSPANKSTAGTKAPTPGKPAEAHGQPDEAVEKKSAAPKSSSSAKAAAGRVTTGKAATGKAAKQMLPSIPPASAKAPLDALEVASAGEATLSESKPPEAAVEAGVAVREPQATIVLSPAAPLAAKAPAFRLSRSRLLAYARLMRIDKPIGSLLLLWPTLWSLWLAAGGVPSLKNLVIFVVGVWVMRSAGCVINDIADRKIDGRVERTRGRPLATGAVSTREAVALFIGLCALAFALVLFTNPLTIKLSLGGLLLAFSYPFMKRYTHLPQVVLGAAFAWGIPMAYAAEAGEIPDKAWLIYLAVVIWTVVYDTFYAMVDREDDLKIGVKSTAILFGEQDRFITGCLQLLMIYCLYLIGQRFELGSIYVLGVGVASGFFLYQQWLIRYRARAACFKAFLNNNWVGAAVFIGIALQLKVG